MLGLVTDGCERRKYVVDVCQRVVVAVGFGVVAPQFVEQRVVEREHQRMRRRSPRMAT